MRQWLQLAALGGRHVHPFSPSLTSPGIRFQEMSRTGYSLRRRQSLTQMRHQSPFATSSCGIKFMVWTERLAMRRREFITLAGAVASLWWPLLGFVPMIR